MWIGKTLHNALAVRVEDLEDTTVHKDTFADVRKLMEEHRTETRNQFNNVQQTLNTILIKVGESNRD